MCLANMHLEFNHVTFLILKSSCVGNRLQEQYIKLNSVSFFHFPEHVSIPHYTLWYTLLLVI